MILSYSNMIIRLHYNHSRILFSCILLSILNFTTTALIIGLSIPYIARVSINAPSGSGTPIAPTMAAPESMQGFRDYLRAEARAQEKLPTADIVWGQTERERVYNFLIFVPYQLERLIEFSFMLCFDCVLGVVTMLPLRCCLAMRTMAANLKKHDPKQDEGHKAKQEEGLQSTSSGLSESP